jgi:hypothetical protein
MMIQNSTTVRITPSLEGGLVRALLENKRDTNPPKKRGNIPL